MCGLKVRFSQSPDVRGVFAYALKVEVTSAVGIPPKIFVFHQMPAGVDGNTFAEFDHIATPVDFQEIPEDAASETVPWYRTDKCTIWCRSLDDLKTAKQLFVDDIAALQRTFEMLSRKDGFSSQTTIEFSGGTVAPAPSEEGGDMISREIEQIKADLSDKIGREALADVEIKANTADGMREAVETIGELLGATVSKRKYGSQGNS